MRSLMSLLFSISSPFCLDAGKRWKQGTADPLMSGCVRSSAKRNLSLFKEILHGTGILYIRVPASIGHTWAYNCNVLCIFHKQDIEYYNGIVRSFHSCIHWIWSGGCPNESPNTDPRCPRKPRPFGASPALPRPIDDGGHRRRRSSPW